MPASDSPNHDEGLCKGCGSEDACRAVWGKSVKSPYSPVGLVAASGLAFLLPIVVGILAGAAVRNFFPEAGVLVQAGAFLAGLIVGGVIGWVLIGVLKKYLYVKDDLC